MDNVNEDGIKQKIEHMVQKINSMTPEDYSEYMDKLSEKIRLIEAELEDSKENSEKVENAHKKREARFSEYVAISAITGIACMASIGMIKYFTGSDVHNSVTTGFSYGSMAGIFASLANLAAYEKKPVSNLINKLKNITLNAKVNKLEKDLYKLSNLQEALKQDDICVEK